LLPFGYKSFLFPSLVYKSKVRKR